MILLICLGLLALLLVIGAGWICKGGYFTLPESTAKPVPELVRWRKDKRRPKSSRLYKAKIVRRKRL